MSLRIELKPHEKLFLNGAVIANGEARSSFMILNNVSILREKDILTEDTADSPCKRIYLVVQLMYMDAVNIRQYGEQYAELKKEVAVAAPSTGHWLHQIDEALLAGQYYQALKAARGLVQYEQELISHVK